MCKSKGYKIPAIDIYKNCIQNNKKIIILDENTIEKEHSEITKELDNKKSIFNPFEI